MSKKFNPFRAALPFLAVTCEGSRTGPEKEMRYAGMAICQALNYVPKGGRVRRDALIKAKAHVTEMLGKNSFVGGYLLDTQPVFRRIWTDDYTHARDLLQAYRYRWLTHMADQFDRQEICQ